MRELPRLTRSLRAFTDLGRLKKLDNEKNNLIAKRLERAAKSNKGPTWSEICKFVDKNAVPYLHQIHHEASSFCEGQTSELKDEAAIFILKLLINENNVSQKNLKILRQTFGLITLEKANTIMQLIKAIRERISEASMEYILNSEEKENGLLDFPPHMFGLDIPFFPAKVTWPETKKLQDMSAKNPIKITSKFTMAYNAETVSSNKTEFEKSRFTKGLKKCYEKYSAEMIYEDFGHMIVDKLKCGGDNLQTELFDLLGYENIEFIEYVLEHQKSIVALFTIQKTQKNNTPILRPQVGCQVIVQSEKEKQLMKQYRKEEKKLNKITNKLENGEDDDEETFDPVELRLKRQEALMRQAMQAPILNTTQRNIFPSGIRAERYPFVFDSKLTARAAAGFVSGQKVMLPENVERKDSQLCEEVHIPVPPAAVLDVGNNPVIISSLDEVGQMAFHGIKSLNRIQSIVFDAAYHTNENLLICAPTGAGKTNVAMLTVIHQIKLHIAQGVLKRDQFKIVYIAPMKALAAEMTSSFNKRLGCLGVSVRELTGDMQLTKVEIQQTQMIVTTPEKWDVVTRKGTGDIALTSIVKLLIIDEVHLLHGDRGPVVEALVARTLRQVESSQSMIRIVGLSATLPNYTDVAKFLRVNPHKGLFYFDHRFRPVPLGQTFIGVKAVKPLQQMADMDLVCYNHVVDMVRKGHQVMVFVHARNATIRTATVLKEMALQNGTQKLFMSDGNTGLAQKALAKSRNKHLGELFSYGFSVHHAGMLRTDRNLVEKYFADGLIKVLVCTSTLAWGVNLPAHAVVIRGTEIYDSKHGTFIDLGILDVLQIFGRAGRPQFDTSGHGTIITTHNKLSHYLSLLTNQFPIESNFITYLADNLNAEITLGTISNVEEAVEWLSYTYLFVRMRLNPQVYGINYQDVIEDPNLERKRKELIDTAAKALDKAKMIRYITRTGDLSVTDLGRTASHFYIKYDTVEIFNEHMKPIMTEADVLGMISRSQEFEQLKVRDDEMDELDNLTTDYCEVLVQGGAENIHGKVNILLQTYLSRGRVNSFSLLSDQSYITQNAVRICRALFEMVLRKNNAIMAGRLLGIAKMLELQQWDHMSPMRQFCCLPQDIITKIEDRHLTMEKLKDMDIKEIGNILRNQKMAGLIKKCCSEFPSLELEANLQPITRTVLRIRLKITPDFRWNDRVHGKSSEAFWIWIEDPDSNFIYHHEYFLVTRKMVYEKADQDLVMTIPLSEPLPTQYFVKAVSDRWLGCEMVLALSFQGLILPETHPPHTDLLELQPLPVTALKDPKFENLYKFSHFNPIQTQIFHCLYHTDNNVLLGAPTGSGKTIAAEIAMFRVFKEYPGQKVVYIAPLKALVRERINDWKVRIEEKLGRTVVELTGDVSPDVRAIASASVIVTTPEKWDGISRSWQTRNYVQKVALIIIDEIHLLGEDRGPVLEVIVSRTNFIASHTSKALRIVGLSTALANAVDLANWLGIEQMGLYNFRPSVRPVPLEVHISGFPGKHYCPRMATMNRPTFQAIRQHAPCSPSLVFVSSRRQTRLTALDLIAYLAAENDPKQWLHMLDDEMDNILVNIKDTNLKLTLAFGIGLHHAGLQDRDRRTVEELFVNNKIQVLITTATLAWGVNFPAHLVVIKGTEYYDGKSKRYVDMPITDVLQMMGRAGRPQFDDSGVAVVLVHDIKKNFYKKFLYEPFPVESSLLEVLPDHINAEIVAGTIKNKQEFLDYLTWTYFFRRLMKNPRYYELEVLDPAEVNLYLSGLVEKTLSVLIDSYCIDYDEGEKCLSPLSMGRIASFYYLSHQTMLLFNNNLKQNLTLEQLLRIACDAYEYNQLPVRHNEDLLNEELAKMCRHAVDSSTLDSPNTKTFLLLQAHFSRLPLPCADYLTDLKSVLDQAIRILQAMIDIVADRGWLGAALRLMQVLQMIIQARWVDESALLTLPHLEKEHLRLFSTLPKSLPMLCTVTHGNYSRLANALQEEFVDSEIQQIHQVIKEMPVISVELTLQGWWADGSTEKKIPQPAGPNCWIDVHESSDYTLIVGMKRKNHSHNLKAHCPKFPRGKDEGWFLILGDETETELLALKRASGIRGQRKCSQLFFSTPPCIGRKKLTFYLMSDCYMGLDQQYDVHLNVIPSSSTDQ
ncbi:activating signal cointegrator 1 complex subunit 3 [Neodiprion fabricii]|uniref:activating signal cointegrator 1 complex subunit 3 n=1 Tax=Neodiprion fabricii TaxID=2872261 RepID=UPI001ED9516C|nr:activating signal cointegrator 1 complex subunit 3 [Neodiprion fabricii]XP_046420629.1 activating signal cointegrator 1 complex subunit 3 [Neodiprion fabricii]XP_046420630.1 activating signal cointegrator 1 complex subunit 3 [Neodiprion fabricii]XP_046420631.1 activating signal cointegrator 1 complex subunit 3 [Neodiprion fabricii]XP_046420632.1 activating signal cointegrator 1 complex subunit 3 [Neodiprion fabricii]XP_046420633.1 activating signal cointegrator 1 complex subunit 3 [Neodipri